MTDTQLATDHGPWDASAAPGSFERILTGAGALLLQGEKLLASITPEQYSARVPVALGGSIGAHYRHCLDHFVSLLRVGNGRVVDFDRRDRDPRIETEPQHALAMTRDIRARLATWEPAELAGGVGTRCEVSYAPGSSPVMGSSLGRELAYAIAHAIHHFAIMAILGRLQGIPMPEDFGIAPSTLAHLREGPSPT